MIFRQLFDSVSGTYTYLLASRRGGEALIIDPVLEKVDRYLQLVNELDLKLVKAVDTHLHADHITGLGALRDRTHCITVMGEQSKADVVSMRLAEGDKLTIEGRRARRALYARPHRQFLQLPDARPRVHRRHAADPRHRPHRFPERRSARAIRLDLQQAAEAAGRHAWCFPAHDYKGETVSTIGEEKAFNPRLQVKSVDEYAELMNNLNLPNPKMMDVAVPANMRVGLAQEAIARRGWAVSAAEAMALIGRPDVALVDLREKTEREKHGVIPGSLHAPYPDLAANVRPGGMLHELAARHRQAHRCSTARSASARRWRCRPRRTPASPRACHIQGGIDAWKKAVRPADAVKSVEPLSAPIRFGRLGGVEKFAKSRSPCRRGW